MEMSLLDQRRGRFAVLLGVGLAGLLSALGAVASASAFNCGYSPCVGSGGSSSGFTTVVTAKTLGASGGSVSGFANGANATVTVPKNALNHPSEIVIGTGPPKTIRVRHGFDVIADFSVSVIDPSTGKAVPTPIGPPLTLTILDSAIRSHDQVVKVQGPGTTSSLNGAAQVGPGRVVVKFNSDENIAVVRPVHAT
jgi:hypothetical protein